MKTFKNLLAILLGGFVAFQALAIAQEWEIFGAAWFGLGGKPEEELSQEELQAAADAVTLTLSLMRHFYASGGDPRFADRMPAGEAVLSELRSEVEYLDRNHRRQLLTLEDYEVTAVEPRGKNRVEVRTREHWSVHTLLISDGREVDPRRASRLQGTYAVVRQGHAWRVEGWDFGGPQSMAGETDESEGGGTP